MAASKLNHVRTGGVSRPLKGGRIYVRVLKCSEFKQVDLFYERIPVNVSAKS